MHFTFRRNVYTTFTFILQLHKLKHNQKFLLWWLVLARLVFPKLKLTPPYRVTWFTNGVKWENLVWCWSENGFHTRYSESFQNSKFEYTFAALRCLPWMVSVVQILINVTLAAREHSSAFVTLGTAVSLKARCGLMRIMWVRWCPLVCALIECHYQMLRLSVRIKCLQCCGYITRSTEGIVHCIDLYVTHKQMTKQRNLFISLYRWQTVWIWESASDCWRLVMGRSGKERSL